MVCRTVETASKTYTVALDDHRCTGQRLWAIVKGRLVDELTGQPVDTRITVETDKEGLVQRSTTGGIAGLVGVPAWVFPLVDPATHAYDLTVNTQAFTVTFRGEGYLSYETGITLGPIPQFPDVFTPVSLGDIEMHRHPIIIRGRVMRNGVTPTPVAGLTVRIDAIWRRLPSATTSPPADAYTVMAISPGLQFPRSATVTQLRRRDLTDVLGEDKALSADFTAGSQHIRCSNRINLSPGDILAIDVGDPSITEYIPIDTIGGASAGDQPAEITLVYPLAHAHRQNAVVRRVSPQFPGANNTFGVDAIAGDTCVLLNSTNDIAGAQTVEISDGTQPDEYRRMFPFTTNTDSGGYFRLPHLNRVAQLNLRVYGGAISTDIDELIPDYSSRENWIDVMI